MTKKIVAVTGATGFVGSIVLQQLQDMGYGIRALTRKEREPVIGVEWIEGALDNQILLERLCDGADCLIHIAGVVNAANKAGFETGNVDGTAAIIKAAKSQNIKRFIHISSLSAREPQLSNYGASKAKAEKLVGASMLDWTIIRPPAIYGPGDMEMLDLFLMARKGYVIMPPKGRASFIHVEDLARLIIALIPSHEDATAQIFECDDGVKGGWSHDSFGRAIGAAIDRQVSAINAPKIMLKIGAIFDRILRGKRAKLTWDRASYLSHPDWVINRTNAPSPALWKPAIETRQGLKDTARWYRKNSLIH